MPIRLTDPEFDAIFAAAQPLSVDRREAFLRHVAHSLQGLRGKLGPGHVHRAIVEAQRAHFDYPDLSRTNDSTKYR